MTEDYKGKLLRYFTNNLKQETGIDEPKFERQNPILKEDIISMLDEKFPYGYYQTGVLQCKNKTGNYNGYIVVYGYYYYQETQSYNTRRSYIMLFDDNMDLLQLITEYSTGTPLNYIIRMNVDEEGNFYGVDMTLSNSGGTITRKNRFIMLNNISLKLPSEDIYKVTLRQSYFLQGSTSFISSPVIYYINKNPNGADYVFTGSGLTALTLKINVGSENEWTYYPRQSSQPYSSIINPRNYYSAWDNEGNLTLCSYTIGVYNNTNYIFKISNSSSEVTVSRLNNFNTLFNDLNNFKLISNGSLFTETTTMSQIIPNNNVGYIMIGGSFIDNDNQYRAIYRMFKINNTTVTKVYEHIEEEPVQNDSPVMYSQMYDINNTIFTNYYIRTNTLSDNGIFNYYCALILDDPSKDITISLATSQSSVINKFHIFSIKNMFNLYTTYFLGQNIETGNIYLTKANIVYNSLNYNGTPYENTNSLVPKQGFLYDNEGIIFARNLYDKVVTGNLTTSTIQIPNTLLNDISITKQQLISETNNTMVENTNVLSKNIYEEILLNFNNTMTISNQNDLSNITYNYNGASKLNNSVSDTIDYSSTTMGKYKINYEDTTNQINELHWYKVGNFYRCKLSVYNPTNNITSIDLISDDETMIYQTIDCSDLEENKIYTIYQDVYIDNKIEAQQVYYDNEEVYYGNEQVYY